MVVINFKQISLFYENFLNIVFNALKKMIFFSFFKNIYFYKKLQYINKY